MKPLSALGRVEAARLSGILFDLDDTFLDHGELTLAAYAALWRLSGAGLRLVVVTGRPAGFGEVMARQWPVDAVVTENGAVAFSRAGGVLERWEKADAPTRRARRIRLADAFEALRGQFAEVRLSDDSHARISDLALDIGESQSVPAETVLRMQAAARKLGMRTFLSSVHLHLTLDPFDKASGSVAFLRERFGIDPTAARYEHAYVGDSGNDAACFFAFPTSFGVANVAANLAQMSVPPRYVAVGVRGAGFAEIADRILMLRCSPPPKPASPSLEL